MLRALQSHLMRPYFGAIIAVRALRRNKLRSGLTGLGIIIGVASVVAMVAVGNGARARIESQVSALGQNLLIVFAGNKKTAGVNAGLGTATTLDLADAQALGREVPDIVAISPEVSTTAQVIAGGRNWSTTVVGESPEYLGIRAWTLSGGSMFVDHDVRAASKVAVIGAKTANQLFGPINPVGQSVRIKNIPFLIIGVLAGKGAGMGGNDQDDRLIIPYTTAMKRITGDKYLRIINVQISASDRMSLAERQIGAILRQRHRLPPESKDDFNILNQKEISDTVGSISAVITIFLGAVAGISLLVGGIGIMNIMLVSITERTREIGIRMAVGAKGSDILLQFLIEAVTLSLLGGTIGVAVGLGLSKLTAVIAGFEAIVSQGSIGLAFTVSFLIGVFFGLYPARRASNLDPIEALRHE